ncbi:chemotaxis protein CheW [Occallatibacter savannae]|uniref:hybrid sensor histidine kinase/response regulator n=1 Tax=Occallatibacter savannae TaxID=1002691 RepID=UPI000D69267F|nr:chemotaxis protein CheW [Occallatibacter savannae]
MDSELNVALNDELLVEFISESRDHLTTIESDLLAMEEGGSNIDSELVNKVFRAAHSIKGASGYFGLTKVKELAHRAETVLDMIRSGRIPPNAEVTNLLLCAFDRLREMINRPGESNGTNIDDLVESLTALASSFLPGEKKSSVWERVTLEPQGGGAPVMLSKFDYERAKDAGNRFYVVEMDLIHDIERRGENVLAVFRRLFAAGQVVDCEVDFESVGTLDDPICNRVPLKLVLATTLGPDKIDVLFPEMQDRVKLLSEHSAEAAKEGSEKTREDSVAEMQAVLETPGSEVAQAQTSHTSIGTSRPVKSNSTEDSVRVNVATLELLMNLAGELVLGRNQLRASIAQKNGQALDAADQRINQITSELQDAVMQTRLQPIGNVFGKFPRLVRDLAASLGKEVQLEIQGKEVALDRSIIESLSDPLTHMVRNAVDHGIEPPEIRIRAGKARQGVLNLDARHEAGHVVVEIADDGRGLDAERIAKSAMSKGLVTAEKLDRMTAKEKMSLIFLPGLSTNSEVSEISGRGVGMDVVKTNLDRLGGKVEIISTVGSGTRFRIKLPLTLAIIPSLIVSVEGERFAIPQINVEEMCHVVPGQGRARVETVGNAQVLVLRDRLIPLVRLGEYLSAGEISDRRGSERDSQREKGDASNIVVVTTGAQSYGLVVSGFHDAEEIVVKPLGGHLKGLEEYAGATILGDGSLALILDVANLAVKASLSATGISDTAAKIAHEDASNDRHTFVLFHNPPNVLCALPLNTVRRIERVDAACVEMIGGRRTMKLDGGLLPLATLSDAAQVEPIPASGELAVILATVRGVDIGLLGTLPVDVVETSGSVEHTTHRQSGIAGSTIIQGRTALIVDLYELADSLLPERGNGRLATERPEPGIERQLTVLLAEDSDFFRSQIERFLKEDGYAVLAANDGEAAWELLLRSLDEVSAVVTDIEMPRLDGLGLTRRIRADALTAHLPVIALTSLAADDDAARGLAAGISDYQTKLDRDRLLERLREYTHAAAAANV